MWRNETERRLRNISISFLLPSVPRTKQVECEVNWNIRAAWRIRARLEPGERRSGASRGPGGDGGSDRRVSVVGGDASAVATRRRLQRINNGGGRADQYFPRLERKGKNQGTRRLKAWLLAGEIVPEKVFGGRRGGGKAKQRKTSKTPWEAYYTKPNNGLTSFSSERNLPYTT